MDNLHFDCVVIGGGISGMESALTLGDMGFKVLLVEREASIGGKMIILSKVFPTLDCSSCISTPKMAATYNHPNITTLTYSEVKSIERLEDGTFDVKITQKPTFVDPSKCTGCSQCEKVCTVARIDQFNEGLIARRAIYIPFPQAVPKKAVIEKKGLSPCSNSCPAGIRAHALVALIRNGRFERAYERHMEDAPFVGSLGYLCYAPCEKHCTKGKRSNKPVSIRELERFIAEKRIVAKPNNNDDGLPCEPPQGKHKIGIVGSGVESLALAYFLCMQGHSVTIFTGGKELGGILLKAKQGGHLPSYILKNDIQGILSKGINVEDIKPASFKEILANGYDVVFTEDKSYTSEDERIFRPETVVEDPCRIVLGIQEAKRIARQIHLFLEGKTVTLKESGKTTGRKLFKHGHYETLPKEDASLRPLLSEEQALEKAMECLDCGSCSECLECKKACPASAIDFSMEPTQLNVKASAIITATGFKLFDPSKKKLLGYEKMPNVITAMQMDRLLSPTRPFNAVLRPSDGKIPGNIALILCTGSRDKTVGNPWCSRICCMYSIKQAQLIMGALPIANVTIYYIDIRAFGKGYDEFYEQAKGMGVVFVKGKVARIEEAPEDDLYLYYEDMERKGGLKRAKHDLVVLSVGALADSEITKAFKDNITQLNELSFFKEIREISDPCISNVDGVFVAGSASGPKDIPDCVVHAGACAAQVASYLKSRGQA